MVNLWSNRWIWKLGKFGQLSSKTLMSKFDNKFRYFDYDISLSLDSKRSRIDTVFNLLSLLWSFLVISFWLPVSALSSLSLPCKSLPRTRHIIYLVTTWWLLADYLVTTWWLHSRWIYVDTLINTLNHLIDNIISRVFGRVNIILCDKYISI